MVDTVYIVETTLSGELNEAEIGYWSQSMIDTKLVACVNIEKIRSSRRLSLNILMISQKYCVGQPNLQKNILIG